MLRMFTVTMGEMAARIVQHIINRKKHRAQQGWLVQQISEYYFSLRGFVMYWCRIGTAKGLGQIIAGRSIAGIGGAGPSKLSCIVITRTYDVYSSWPKNELLVETSHRTDARETADIVHESY